MSIKDDFGKVPLCNHRADRGIYIHGFCLPLCSRCTGLLIGSLSGAAALHMLAKNNRGNKGISTAACLGLGAAMLAPTAMDGAAEYFGGKESNNRRRLLTGLLAGAGCAIIERSFIDFVKK